MSSRVSSRGAVELNLRKDLGNVKKNKAKQDNLKGYLVNVNIKTNNQVSKPVDNNEKGFDKMELAEVIALILIKIAKAILF